MNKKNPRSKGVDIEKDLLIKNFFSEVNFCEFKPRHRRLFALSSLLVVITALGIGIISIIAATNTTVPITVVIPPPPPAYTLAPVPVSVSLTAAPNPVDYNTSSVLSWAVLGDVASCIASGDWIGDKSIAGGLENTPDLTLAKTYALICTGSGGTDTVTITVNVNPPPTPVVDLVADKVLIDAGEVATLTWSTSNTTSCSASGGADWNGSKPTNNSSGQTIALPSIPGSYAYTLTCDGVFDSVTIDVVALTPCGNGICEVSRGEDEATCPVDCVLKPKPEEPIPIKKEIFKGLEEEVPELTMTTTTPVIKLGIDKTIDISWSSPKAKFCSASGVSGWVGIKSNIGRESVIPPQKPGEYTYVLVCETENGKKTTAFLKIKILESRLENEVTTIPNEKKTVGLGESFVSSLAGFKERRDVKAIANNIVAPLVAISLAANLYSAIISLINSLLPFLNYLFNLILQFFSIRRKEKPWGLIYDSVTKEPVDLAIVRLFEAGSNILKQTVVTDKSGRFGFTLAAGKYHIMAVKRKYIFPSKLIKGSSIDSKYHNLYFGENIVVNSRKGLNISVPLDPVTAVEAKINSFDRLKNLFIRIALPLLIISFLLSLFVLWVDATITNGSLSVLYILTIIFRGRLKPGALKPWGKIYDKKTGISIAGVPLKIFDKKYSKLLETKVSDREGKFSFLLPKGEYYLRLASFKYQMTSENKVKNKEGNYFGENFIVREGQAVSFNIPVVRFSRK